MRDLQGIQEPAGSFYGDGGNRTREPFPPCLLATDDDESTLYAGESQQWLYRLYDAADALLYVGVTKHGVRRFAEHEASKSWWAQVAYGTVETYGSRADVLAAERRAIYREKPRHNVAHASTGRRLFGDVPIPLSEPLTRETVERMARARLLAIWDDPASPPAEVVSLAARRGRRGSPVRNHPKGPV